MPRGKTKILVVDDEEAMREVLDLRLREWGFDVRLAADGLEAKKVTQQYNPDIVITDVVMPELSGVDLLRELRADDPNRPVLLITAHASVDVAVEAMKEGALDFITKPLEYPKLRAILDAAEGELELRRESRKLKSQLDKGSGLGEMVGTSKKMREMYDMIRSVSSSDASVILTGESGTGKEVAARAIHELSARAKGPFVPINASAIPESLMESELFGHERGAFTGAVGVRAGCFEMANRGTLFFDEIAEMPIQLQPKLLRVLEDGRVRRVGGSHEFSVDVRVLAATNLEPASAVESGKLRQDLYYRLNVFTVSMPPLRERTDDLPLLVQHFIGEFNAKHGTKIDGVREDTLSLLKQYAWPGNVRELRNVMERGVILASGSWIERHHLPPYIRADGTDKRAKTKES